MRPVLETARGGKARHGARWPWPLVAVVLIVGVVAVIALLRGGGAPEPDETSPGAGVEDIVVSGEDALYPPPDVDTFSVSPKTLYVYLVVDGLAAEELKASVERSDRTTVVSWLFSKPQQLKVRDEGEERLAEDGEEVSGLIKFSIHSASGQPVASGDYAVSVRNAGDETLVAKKSFVVAE